MTRSFLVAIRMLQQSLEIFTRLGDRKGRACCLSNLGLVYEESGQHEKAKGLLQRTLPVFREIGCRDALAIGLEVLGRATLGLGEYERAKQSYGETLKTAMAIQSIPAALAALLGPAR